MTVLLERPREMRAAIASSPAARALAPLVLYAAFAAVWIGRGVIAHPQTRVLGDADRDKTLILWSFRWWPHALVHGHDPFNANVVWVPHGVDLAWVTTAPTLAFVMSPVTATLGPVFAYNLAALAAAPLAAWTTYLLARRLTANVPASLVAGFLFGFSPYVIAQSINHLHLAFVCLVPLAALLAVRFFEGSLSGRRYAILLGLVLALQFGISIEIFATMTLLAAVCFVLAALLRGDARSRLAALARYTVLAYVAVAVVATPYLVHAFSGSLGPTVRPHAHRHILDFANLVYPTETTWFGLANSASITNRFTSSIAEIGGYLGIPLLIILLLAVVFARPGRVRRGVWLLVIAAVVADAMAAGPKMKVDGRVIAQGVWALFIHLPAIGEAMPVRLAMYAVLCIALVVALWLAEPSFRLWRFALAGLAIVFFLPNPHSAFWTSPVKNPAFFATGAYRQVIHPGDVALVFPYAARVSWSMYWQAETGFRFRMIGGHTGQAVIPKECPWVGDWESLAGGMPPGRAGGFRRFLLAHGTTVIIEAPATTGWARRLVAASLPDVRPVKVLGTKVYRLRPDLPLSLPASRRPPLVSTRDLNNEPGRAICGH